MRNPFDYLAKKIGKEALDACGLTIVEREVSREAQRADIFHDPDPARDAERARLGLLGRMAAVPCLIEVYAHMPDGAEIRACLSKHLAYWAERDRKTRALNRRRSEKRSPPEPLVEPFLWILAPAMSAPMLRALRAGPAPGFPPGVHALNGDVLRVGIVVASELPRDRSTLLVRIMAAGPGLHDALEDLAALPKGAHERAVAEGIMLHLSRVLGTRPSHTPEEEEFIVSMLGDWWAEERALGRAEAAARAVLTVLRVRGIAVSEEARERILAQKDPERLERWHEKAIVAASLEEVLGRPRRRAATKSPARPRARVEKPGRAPRKRRAS